MEKIIGTVLLDFSVAFDILDHDLLLEKFNNTDVLLLHYCGLRVIYMTDSNQYISVEVIQKLNELSMGCPKEVALGLSCTQCLRMIFR